MSLFTAPRCFHVPHPAFTLGIPGGAAALAIFTPHWLWGYSSATARIVSSPQC